MKDLRKKSLLLTGYMELLLKQNFLKTPEEGEELDTKRPRMADRGVSLDSLIFCWDLVMAYTQCFTGHLYIQALIYTYIMNIIYYVHDYLCVNPSCSGILHNYMFTQCL